MRMSEPSGMIRVKDTTKIRLNNLKRDGESIDDTIQRMLDVLEIKAPRIRKMEVRK